MWAITCPIPYMSTRSAITIWRHVMFRTNQIRRMLAIFVASTFLISVGVSGCASTKKSNRKSVVQSKKKYKSKKRRRSRNSRQYSKTKKARIKGFGYRKGDAKLLRKGKTARHSQSLDSW